MEELFLAVVGGAVVVYLAGKSKKIRKATRNMMKNEQGAAYSVKSALAEVTTYLKDLADESRAEMEAARVAVAEVRLHSKKA